jgi:hypothetical protein
MVRKGGLEPPWVAQPDPKSGASANINDVNKDFIPLQLCDCRQFVGTDFSMARRSDVVAALAHLDDARKRQKAPVET